MRLKRLRIEDRALFLKYYKDSPPECSYLSFANLFIWKDAEEISYFEYNDMLIVTGKSLYDGTRYVMFPIGRDLCSKMKPMLISNFSENFRIYGMTKKDVEKMEQKCGDEFLIKRETDMDNYVYLTEKLTTLAGKKLHSKRNHINRFKEQYNYTYERLSDENFIQLQQFIERWYSEKETSDSLKRERTAVYNSLLYHKELSLKCGILKVDDKIAAFSVGEQLNEETALIHIEKADTSYDGAYAVINNEFVKNEWQHCKYINREDDMGLPGLRKAKQSYHPELMVEMYSAAPQKGSF